MKSTLSFIVLTVHALIWRWERRFSGVLAASARACQRQLPSPTFSMMRPSGIQTAEFPAEGCISTSEVLSGELRGLLRTPEPPLPRLSSGYASTVRGVPLAIRGFTTRSFKEKSITRSEMTGRAEPLDLRLASFVTSTSLILPSPQSTACWMTFNSSFLLARNIQAAPPRRRSLDSTETFPKPNSPARASMSVRCQWEGVPVIRHKHKGGDQRTSDAETLMPNCLSPKARPWEASLLTRWK